jgi:DNA-binding transcriptional LysR family regulator
MARINFQLGEVQAFIAVAETLNFKAAADALFLSQPALSRRIDKLEQTLNVRLLERTTRRVALTDAGRHFLDHAKSAVEELEMAALGLWQQAAQRNALITVACVPSVANHLLPGVLVAFAKEFPQTRIKVIDEGAREVLACVVAGAADFGLDFIGTQEPDIDFKAIYKEHYLLAMRKGHAYAKKAAIAWSDLAEEKLISVAASSGNRILLDHALARIEKRPSVFYEANHIAGALGMVEAGLGVAAVPSLALSKNAHPGIVGVALVKPTVARTLGLISRKGRQLHPGAAALYEMLKKSLGN